MSDPARLSPDVLTRLPETIARPDYDRDAQAVGIVHFGIGAFHRAHQAWYTDAAMRQGERDWMILGVSLRSADVAQQMNPQAGLYGVIERSAKGASVRIVGAVRGVLVAKDEPEAVTAALAAPTTRIVSLTITEKGYCRTATGDLDHAAADESSVFRFLAEGLRRRCDAGLFGLTLLSCDNLAENGHQLERLMRQYLSRHDPALLAWFADACTCPSTMVDRIVPATTPDDRSMAASMLGGLRDEAAVFTEPFSQWIIEDRFAGPHPAWEEAGARFVGNVAPFEMAKLRMLNAAHSLLAYCGLARGHVYVHQAVADPELLGLVRTLLMSEAAPTIAAEPGQDLAAYAEDLLARFTNPALEHRLAQIAMDGSQKLPQRWLATLAENAAHGRECPAILTGLGAWIRHLQGHNGPVSDPLAARLGEAAIAKDPVAALFGREGLLASGWVPTQTDTDLVLRSLQKTSLPAV
ncbi:mannitol dehydrogenase family protein [Novosphingobium sp. AAP93]|uniref:mannitol dehydrogenase family protein n=1 Tax=Novosphingobium sp. AAP93 TaxID=1523427 RepID=UPI0006B8A9F7|nr:mannitol dehydrogenase family protein [Novosphingobium sp. AAP93]KPF86652.1 dioxygenase [Novosphingobium sp. AAP93]